MFREIELLQDKKPYFHYAYLGGLEKEGNSFETVFESSNHSTVGYHPHSLPSTDPVSHNSNSSDG